MGKRLPAKKGAVKRSAVKKPAKKPKKAAKARKAAAVKTGWGTPRVYDTSAIEKARVKAAKASVAAKRRSEAAKRGWQKRHVKALETEGLNPRSAAVLGGLDANRQQLLHDMRLAVLGVAGFDEELTGRSETGLQILRDFIQYRDKRWETFTNSAQSAGFTSQQARTAFFSPSVRRMMQARAPGLRAS
jgi:hypothetical protein